MLIALLLWGYAKAAYHGSSVSFIGGGGWTSLTSEIPGKNETRISREP